MVEPEPPAAAGRIWTVGALLLAVGDALAARFASCAVQGEIAAFTRAASGHCYFTLKDAEGADAAVRCAMFRRAASLLDFAPREGQKVELRGRVALYEPRGEMQFVVESMRALGAGSLYEQFLRLKAKLEADGLFDAARKRALRLHPRRVGVVTSTAGAALHDIATTFARRAPQVELIVYPSLVQGAQAPAALVEALRTAAARREVEVLIVARGGGSIEDLWAFNDERVVRALAAMPMPVIAGVGHETDVTLADFVADRRAATPTAAAEIAAPARDELLQALQGQARRLRRAAARQLDRRAQGLDRLALQLRAPRDRVARALEQLQHRGGRLAAALARRHEREHHALARWHERWRSALHKRLDTKQAALDGLEGRLRALDPSRVLARGYAFVFDDQGRPVVAAAGVSPGQALELAWQDGRVITRVERRKR